MAKIPAKKDSKSDPVLDTLKSIEKQLISINGEVTNTSDTALRQNSHLKALVESLNTSTPAKVSKEKAVNPEVEALKIAVEEERLQRLKDRNAADKKKDEDDAAARMVKLKSAEEDLKIKQVRLQTATQRLTDMQELAQERARILAERAEQKLQADKKDPARNYGPVAALGRGVNAVRTNQPSTLSRAVTMALTGGIGNIFGLDKVLDATAGGIGKLAGNAIGAPFKALAKKRQQKKADKEAIRQAIHNAELQKRIQGELEARGLSESQNENSENTENVPTEKPKGRPKKNQKQIPGGTNLKGKSSGEAKKGSGTTADRKKNPMKGVEDRLDKIDNTLKKLSKPKVEEKKKEGKGIFDMLLKGLASLASFAGKGLASLGRVIMHGIIAAAPVIAPILAVAIGGVIGAYLAGKAVDWIDENTNLTGGKSARASMKAAAGVGKKENKDAAQMAGGMAEFDLLNTQYEENKEELEAGRVWGKSSEKVAQWRRMRANAARNSLKLSGYENVVTTIDEAIKNKQISKEAGEDLLINRAKDVTERTKAANQGRDLEEVKAENLSRIENHKAKVAEAERKQNFNIKEKEANRKQKWAEKKAERQALNVRDTGDALIYGDVAKQKAAETLLNKQHLEAAAEARKDAKENPEMGSVYEKVAEEYEEMTKFTGAMRTWAENDDMYAVEINKDLLTNSGQLSEEGILILKKQGVTDQQMQQIQNVMNNSTNNNGSNIYQTNITQHNDTGVYATGDAARTMAM